jgi:hypothetical protein
VVALVIVAGVQSTLIWWEMAGERIALAQQTPASASRPTRALEVNEGPGTIHQAARRRESAAASTPAPPAETTNSAPSTMSGTTLAVGLIALTGALTFLTARAALRRRAPNTEDTADTEASGASQDTGDPESTDAAVAAGAQLGRDNHLSGLASVTADAEPGSFAISARRVRATLEGPPAADGDPEGGADVAGCDGAKPDGAALAGHLRDHLPCGPPGDIGAASPSPARPKPAAGREVGSCPAGSSRVVLFDRRLTQRVAFESKARLQWDGHDLGCTTVDLSLSGVGCRLPADLPAPPHPPVGTQVQVTLLLDGAPGVFRARVQWGRIENGGPAVGLRFVQLHDRQRALLQPTILRGAT